MPTGIEKHFGLSEEQSVLLESEGITQMELMNCTRMFGDSESAISKVSLMYYIDEHGDIMEGDEVHKKIARAVFNSLCDADKFDVINYMMEDE